MIHTKTVIGWREWVGFPELNIERIKAKIDTGAKSSALHATDIRYYTHHGTDFIEFCVHPFFPNHDTTIFCQAPVIDTRSIKDSGGRAERRHIIVTLLKIGDQEWPIELSLTNRKNMTYPLLIGRSAMRQRFYVDVDHSYLMKKKNKKQ